MLAKLIGAGLFGFVCARAVDLRSDFFELWNVTSSSNNLEIL